MNENTAQPSRSKFDIWAQAARPFSFPASMVSVFVAGALALSYDGPKNWWLFPIVLICGFLYHSAANVHSDYFDHMRQVDRNYTFGGSRVLTGNLLSPREAYIGAWIILAVASLLGLVLVYYRGLPMLGLGLVGLLGGYFYCASPVGYKYYGFGDLMVFLLFGTLMILGSYFALTGTFSWQAVMVSIPVGSLIAAILSANNTRDIKHDTEAGIKTLESMLGMRGGIIVYSTLIIAAYLSIVFMVAARIVPIWTLVVFLSLPIAIKNLKAIRQGNIEHPERIATVDVTTAQLHAAFGTLLVISIAIGALV
ncbi:1,4-dihydroxy-2-naphthoate octaprenyltransferase [bacterium]|nr:1,4-dihydroxy-2-naphthoate octaprenyltransferase [bacterium]